MAHLGHALLSLLLLLLVSEVVSIRHVVKPQDQQQTLQQIANLIKSRGEISPGTIGSGLFRQTLPVLKQNSALQANVVNSTVNNDVLEVYVKTTLWNYNVLLKLTFWFASPQDSEPQLQLEFNAVTASLASLFSNIRSPATNNTLPAPSFASELDLAGTVDLVLSTVNYNNFKAGLTFGAITTISSTSTSLLPAFATLRGSSAGKIQLNTKLFAPIFSANPTYFTLSLQESGAFALTSAIQCNNYQLNVNVAQQSTITLTTALQIAVKNQAQPLNIGVAANWQSSSSTTSFKGTLTSTWNNAFGFDWLSLSSSTLTLVVGPSVSVNSISFVGQALISFSSAPSIPAQLSVSLNGNGDYLLSISGVPIGNDLEGLYKAVTHQSSKPQSLNGVTVTGSATFTVATYNAGNTKQGFTMTAGVSLSDASSKLYKAAQVLQASPSSITYNFSLYLPIFNAQQLGDFQVKLSEFGNFALTSHIQVNNYYISLSVAQSVPTVTITSQITLLTSSQNVPLVINGQFDEQQGSASFTGALNGVWQKAFGLDWLTLNSGTLAIVIGSQTVTSANLNGVAILTFFSSPVNVLFNIKGDGNYAVLVSGLPLGSMGSIFTTIAKIAAPSHFNDLSLSGSISFAVSTYASQQAKEGLTVTVQATIASQSSVFYKAAKVLQANPSSQTFVVTVYVPIFQQSGSVTFDLSETGSFSLGQAVSVNSYSIDVVVSGSDTSSVNINAVVAVQPQKQAQPTLFEVTAAFSESAEDVTFTGKLQSAWSNALGLSWLTIKTASLSFTVGSNVNVDNIALTASAALSFSPSPADLQITIKPSGDFSFAVTNVPINSLVFIYHSVTGLDPPQYMWGVSVSQGSLSFAVATYNTGTYQAGLTAKATATLLGEQTLTSAARVLLSDPTSKTYTVDFFIPIFSANPEYFQLSLSEQGSFSLTKNIQCQSFSLNVDVSADTRISLSTDLSVTLAKQDQPLAFDITGNFDEQGSVTFTGALQGTWQKPFGLSWLSISDVSINVAIGSAAVESLSLQGTGLITVDNGSERVTLAIQTASNFEDISLSATVQAQWSFNDFAKSIVGQEIAVLDDLVKQSTASFSVVLSTYDHDSVKSGLSLEAKGNIQGAVSKRVSGLSSKEDFNTIVFEIALIIPIFSADPADVAVQLIYDEQIAISSNFFYEGIKFELDTLPLDVSADATFLAKFKKNPDLTFDIGAEVKIDGSALFTGEMIGTWTDVFGWKGFNLSNVIVEFGVNPSMCAVDFCISDVGLGFQMSMGTKTIIFDGNAASPDYEDLFLEGAVDGKNGMALTMRDVVWEWNEMVPALRIPIGDVPDNWGLKDASFYFAPADGHFGDIYYSAGFAFKGGITLLDMDLDFAINCTDKTWDFCNFAIHVDLDWDLFKQMIERELRLMNAESSLTVFSIEQLSLTQWSVKNYADQVYPFWDIQIKVLDKVHHLQFTVEQYELASSFSDFFHKWLKSIF